MKVLMQGRLELFNTGGGDKIQIENTAQELREIDVDVDIKTEINVDVSNYDIVHVFQLDWTPETYFYVKNAKKYGKPVVLSPIHHSVREVKKFDDKYVFDLRRISKVIISDQHKRDTLKNIYRSFTFSKKAVPTLMSVFMGLENMHKKTLKMADVILVQTEAEAKDLKDTYKVDFEWKKVPNGVGKQFLNKKSYANFFDFSDYILCTGRIEPRKNQLNIIEAVKRFREKHNIDIKLVLVGNLRQKAHPEYTYRFNMILKKYPWIRHLERVDYSEMPSLYHFAKVNVSASWFETTGLTSLEAIFCGTNAVASGERAREYLGEYASYCEPDNIDSIADAIKKEFYSLRPVITEKMMTEYTWVNAAKKTLEVYQSICK